jgi:hypothetical protein
MELEFAVGYGEKSRYNLQKALSPDCPMVLIIFFFFLVVRGLELRASCSLGFARQAFYHLSHSTSPVLIIFDRCYGLTMVCPTQAHVLKSCSQTSRAILVAGGNFRRWGLPGRSRSLRECSLSFGEHLVFGAFPLLSAFGPP